MSIKYLAYEVYWNVLSRNINPIATQQAVLDNALVPSEKRLKIERCNARIAFSKPQKEETYQVTLEAPKLSPCYPVFQITADVLEIHKHQFWNTDEMIKTRMKTPPLDQIEGQKEESQSTQAEELEFEVADIKMQQDQGNKSSHIDDQPNNEVTPKHDWFQKPDKPPTPDRPAFNTLKGTCKSFAKLEYHFEKCYKAVNNRLDRNNPKGHEYPFDFSKPLPLVEDRGCQEVPADYFINNDLEYLKGVRNKMLQAIPTASAFFHCPAPTVESSPDDTQNRNPSVTETEASPCTILPKPFIKFVKPADSLTVVKTEKNETVRKP
nr:hypothetical protein [Tanacetum cinerariifolium]